MRAPRQETRVTEEALYTLPDDGSRHELVAGRLVAEPRPAFDHGELQVRMAHLLVSFVAPRRLGRVVTESGFVLARDPDTVRGPDVAFVAAERFRKALPAPGRFFDGAPDLAIEIVSPSNRPEEIHGKVADYLAAGARVVWVLDPATRSARIYRTLLAPRTLGVGDSLDGEDVLPGFSLPLADLFEA